jgi:arylsulfatase A-like enzyme
LQMLPLYGELCRIPLLAHYPGCAAGTVVNGLIQPVHLGPTVLDFMGLAAPHSFRAPSAWPLLQGKTEQITDAIVSAPVLEHGPSFGYVPSDRATVTDGRWLLVCGPSNSAHDDSAGWDEGPPPLTPLTHEPVVPELYDLQTDPGCLKNLCAHERERAHDLQRHLNPFIERSRNLA